MERLICWKISGSEADRLALPEHFRPTDAQLSSFSHPIVIDFIRWPSIRRQMIIHGHSLDLDALCRDLVLSTVVEIPSRHLAISVYEIIHIRALQNGGRTSTSSFKSSLLDPEWTFVKVTEDSPLYFWSTNPAEDYLVEEITRRVGQHHSAAISEIADGDQGSQTPNCATNGGAREAKTAQKTSRGKTVIGSFKKGSGIGFDNTTNWKLNKAFAERYPWIDCTGGESHFPF